MSDTENWGTCGHEWINFGAWVTGDLVEGEEHAVEAQFAASDTCWDELEETITVSALLMRRRVARRWHPREDCLGGQPRQGCRV